MRIVKLAAAMLALAALYAFECWVWPFAKCSRCSGTGQRDSPDGQHWGDCRRCKGRGRRIRAGRWVFNYFAKRRREATRGQG
jgi:hypothetical protein